MLFWTKPLLYITCNTIYTYMTKFSWTETCMTKDRDFTAGKTNGFVKDKYVLLDEVRFTFFIYINVNKLTGLFYIRFTFFFKNKSRSSDLLRELMRRW